MGVRPLRGGAGCPSACGTLLPLPALSADDRILPRCWVRVDNAGVWAVEIYLDADSEERVASVWAALDARGIQPLGQVPDTEYRPHVSLAVFGNGDPDRLCAGLAPVMRPSMGMPLTLASLGFFVSDDLIAFLAVTPTERLLDVHRRVHVALEGVASDSWAYYEPGAFVPHCTLAMGSDDAQVVVDAVSGDRLPIPAVAREAHLVEISTGRSHARLM